MKESLSSHGSWEKSEEKLSNHKFILDDDSTERIWNRIHKSTTDEMEICNFLFVSVALNVQFQ